MKRSKFTLSHYAMRTGDMGQLIPIACVPVLPGDTFQHRTSALVRVSPLNTPVMHPVQVRIHHFFVPNRLLWPESENGGWEQFITGGPDGMNNQNIPTMDAPESRNRLNAYLGVPPVVSNPGGAVQVNALPNRGYNMIYNAYYRDQDIEQEIPLTNESIQYIAWEKDYLTTARPWAQKGPQVTVPVGNKAFITHDGAEGDLAALKLTDGSAHSLNTSGATAAIGGVSNQDPQFNMYADLANAIGVSVNEFRASFAIQRYQEARARYGSRFVEYLRYLGVKSSDARLQNPEYLGGGTARLSFSEVLQTTPATEPDTFGVGDLYGHGIAGVRTNAYRKFFEEHGYVYTLLSVRPKAIYQNGVHREWFKQTKEDYYQKELVHLGQQEVLKGEVNLDRADYSDTFGFQDRYDEYRTHPSTVANDFRTTLNSWHLARDLPNDTELNPDFIRCIPSKRIHQVSTDHVLWIMANHHLVARRLLPKRAYPRIL